MRKNIVSISLVNISLLWHFFHKWSKNPEDLTENSNSNCLHISPSRFPWIPAPTHTQLFSCVELSYRYEEAASNARSWELVLQTEAWLPSVHHTSSSTVKRQHSPENKSIILCKNSHILFGHLFFLPMLEIYLLFCCVSLKKILLPFFWVITYFLPFFNPVSPSATYSWHKLFGYITSVTYTSFKTWPTLRPGECRYMIAFLPNWAKYTVFHIKLL